MCESGQSVPALSGSDGDWNRSTEILAQAAGVPEKAEADFIVICTNAMRKVAPEIIQSCTEIGLLIQQSDTDILLFDTTLIHTRGAALYAVE